MELLLRLEVYFLFLFYPITVGLLLRRKKIKLKFLILVTNTLVSMFFGTLYLYSAISGQLYSSIFMLPLKEWVSLIAGSVVLWLFLYLMTKPFQKN